MFRFNIRDGLDKKAKNKGKELLVKIADTLFKLNFIKNDYFKKIFQTFTHKVEIIDNHYCIAFSPKKWESKALYYLE